MAEDMKQNKSEDKKKILLIICDGMADRPVKELSMKTPLQYAKKKNMDRIATDGACGIIDPIGKGIRPGSDTAHLALLGYNPFEVYTGRGPFEALGIGMEVEPGDVAFRCNFATVDDRMTVLDRRAGRISGDTKELAESLDGIEISGVEIIFREAVEHRAVLILRKGGELSAEITDVDPHKERKVPMLSTPLPSSSRPKEAKFTADVLNEFVRRSYKLLSRHPINVKREKAGLKPANIILPRGAGMAPHIERITQKYGLTSSCVAGISLVRGICRYVGMDIAEVKGVTGGVDTLMEAKMKAALKELESKDFVLVNIKACDIYGHDADAMGKVKCIQKIDAALGKLLYGIPDDVIFALTADHSTPVTVRDHSGDPVPLAILGPGVRIDNVKTYDEIACAHGSLGRIRGAELLPILVDLANRSEKFGA